MTMPDETASEVLRAWETSSQYWTKHQSLIAVMFEPLTSALIEAASGRVSQCSTLVEEAANHP